MAASRSKNVPNTRPSTRRAHQRPIRLRNNSNTVVGSDKSCIKLRMTVALLRRRSRGRQQKMCRVVDELGISAMGLFESRQFAREFPIDPTIGIPARISDKSAVKHVKTANVADIEMGRDQAAQF